MSIADALEIRSDDLKHLRPLIESIQSQTEVDLGLVFQMVLIPDANRIIKDLMWLVEKRANPKARTKLQEVLDSETVRAIAPPFLDIEVQRWIRRRCRERVTSPHCYCKEWQAYKSQIEFRKPTYSGGTSWNRKGDLKDTPYIALQRETRALVYSDDSDILEMGGIVIREQAVDELQTYARETSIHLTLLVDSSIGLLLSAKAVKGAFALMATGYKLFRRLPTSVKMTLGIVGVGTLLHPRSRRYIRRKGTEVLDVAMSGFSTLGRDVLLPLAEEMGSSRQSADQALQRAQASVQHLNE